MTAKKIMRLEELASLLEQKRAESKRIVQCHGVFDLLHIGHVRHFEQARQMGDILVVTLTPDRFVNKGIGRPAFTETLRAEFVAALEWVDYVAINRWPSAVETVRLLRPHVFVKGSEFRDLKDTIGHVAKESAAVQAVGGTIAFTEDITFSSSALINRYLSQLPEAAKEFLHELGTRYSSSELLEPLVAAADLKVLVVGETILDEYAYCETLGKSGKEPTLVGRSLYTDRFAGGVLACANHAASFCSSVTVLTCLGEGADQEPFIRRCLKDNVDLNFVTKKNTSTIVKKRYVEKCGGQKLFELYSMCDEPLEADAEQEFLNHLENLLPHHDVVIVADYGHGLLSPKAIEYLSRKARFLAVNTQANAGNQGFNLISKYPHADYVSLAQREIALETRNRRLSLEDMVRDVADKLSCPRVLMTRGSEGSLLYSAPYSYLRFPALATQVVDRVGAGDAVLSVTALLAALETPAEIIGFIGSVVGAEAGNFMGNERSIDRLSLFRHVECLLKSHKWAPSPTRLQVVA